MSGCLQRVSLISLVLLLSFPPATSASGRSVIAEDYKDKKIPQAVLAVAPLLQAPVIKNADDVKDDLGEGDPAQVFLSFLQTNLPSALRQASSLREVRFGALKATPTLHAETLDLGRKYWFFGSRDLLQVQLPAPGESVQFEDFAPDFVLFFEDFTVSRESEPAPPENTADVLYYRAIFVIWDNKRGRVVSYGRAEGNNEVWWRMTKETWRKALDDLAGSILRDSPFAQ